jgi:alkylation response protein AidB-like acyl-CoA dehydrogenase
MGIEGFQQFFLFFDGVEVPIEQRLGEEHMGAQVLFAALNPERILAGAFGVGMSAFALRRAAAYARERTVFGDTPIAAYQGVQHPLARAKINQEAARLMTYRAAAAFDRGLPPAEVGLLANMAKYLASEVAVESVDHAIQTLGGSGFVKEHKLISIWAPARLMKTVPINNEMILNYVAENALGLPRSY